MRNVAGAPVEGDDFFDRQAEIVDFVREIVNSANILQAAARRVGKTSFVLRLCEILNNPSFDTAVLGALEQAGLLDPLKQLRMKTTFFTVEGCHDELDFAERLTENLRRIGCQPGLLEKAESGIKRLRRTLGIAKLGASGVDVELSDTTGVDSLAGMLESILRGIEDSDEQRTVLIAIDELPELLLTISKEENGKHRVERFLHWLRTMRQSYRKRVRWLFLGSIGLDTFVDQRGMRRTINDLVVKSLDAYSKADAKVFLDRLASAVGLELPQESCEVMLDAVGWPLPYHLQLMIHSLVELKSPQINSRLRPVVSIKDVGDAIEHLLRPAGFGNFDTWRQRLQDQFDQDHYRAANRILTLLCQSPDGRSRRDLLDELMRAPNNPDPSDTERKLADLIVVLMRDGYLVEKEGRYSFRSFLLREYWFRREVK